MVGGSFRLLVGVLPALAVFVVGLGLQFFPVSYAAETNVIGLGEAISVKPGGLFFMEDYLSANSSATSYAGYWDLALNVGLLFAVLFLPYIFLVVKGFFRNGVLDLWTGLLVVGAFGCLLVPFAALTLWWRWMFMLVYPLTFYALSGLRRLFGKSREGKIRFASLISSKKSAVIVLLTFGLGAAYLATPVLIAFAGASVPFFPSTSLYFSTSPCVPYEDVDSVIQAMTWLNSNLDQDSIVVLQYVFLSWGQLYLDNSHTIMNVHSDVDLAVNTAFDHGFTRVFFVYWNQPIGWTTVVVPERFVSVQDFGRISVYVSENASIGV